MARFQVDSFPLFVCVPDAMIYLPGNYLPTKLSHPPSLSPSLLLSLSLPYIDLLEGVIVLEEFCKELAAVAFVKFHAASGR